MTLKPSAGRQLNRSGRSARSASRCRSNTSFAISPFSSGRWNMATPQTQRLTSQGSTVVRSMKRTPESNAEPKSNYRVHHCLAGRDFGSFSKFRHVVGDKLRERDGSCRLRDKRCKFYILALNVSEVNNSPFVQFNSQDVLTQPSMSDFGV